MNESIRNEIVRRYFAGQSQRQIARELHISRPAIQRVLAKVQQQRAQGTTPPELQPRPRRARCVDAYEEQLQELLRRYPQLSARRVWEELRAQGFTGSYARVWERVRALRPKAPPEPVVRFETPASLQAQVDFSVYDINFTIEGPRRVYLFSYLLGYSRRQYLHFGEAQDFATTLREHVRAFHYLGGLARECLYDNMKVVVLRWEDGMPIYNPRFLAFATHYGFRPRACRPRRPRTKGKVEKKFAFVQDSLLAGRTFQTLAHLNEVTLWWLANVADVRVHRESKQTPLQRYAEEQPLLLPLPAQAYNVDAVVYRTVSGTGFVPWKGNFYSVPYRHIGQLVPVRLTEVELVIYSPSLEEITRHPLVPRHVTGQQSELPGHHPQADSRDEQAQLAARFTALGPVAERFYQGLVQSQRYSRQQAQQVLGLLGRYARQDVVAALERAVRYGAFTAAAIVRILAAQAQPRALRHELTEQDLAHLQPLLQDNPIPPRPTADYQPLLHEETEHGPSTPPPTPTSDPSDPSTTAERPEDSADPADGGGPGHAAGPG